MADADLDDFTAELEGNIKRDFWWYLMAILGTLGILGGPIAIAEMFDKIIYWHGPVQYIVHWWNEYISSPLDNMFEWFARLINIPVPLPEWTKWITDYLVLGVLLYWSAFRARALITGVQDEKPQDALAVFFPVVLLWPIFTIVSLTHVRSPKLSEELEQSIAKWRVHYADRARMVFRKRQRRIFAITIAPFALFLLLWGLNFLMEIGVIPGRDFQSSP